MTDKKIYITVDFFLTRWAEHSDRLWVCLQPHVRQDALIAWVKDSADLAAWTYSFMTDQSASQIRPIYVPVPFGDQENVTLALLGDDNKPLIKKFNDRRAGVKIVDAGAFERANRVVQADQTAPDPPAVEQLKPGPFAQRYNQSLRDAQTSALSSSELQSMLQMAFWGGVQRVVPSDAVTVGQNIDLMYLEADTDVPVTNLHSLLGQMFQVGTFADRNTLTAAMDFNVSIDSIDLNADEHSVIVSTPQNTRATFHTMMAGLKDKLTLKEDVQLTWSDEIANAVYVKENGTAFVQQGDGSSPWFARTRSPGEGRAPSAFRLSELVRLVVVPHKPAAGETDPLMELGELPGELKFKLYDTYEAHLTPFRRVPVADDSQPRIQQLTPSAEHAARFYTALQAQPNFLENDSVFLAADGTELQLQIVGSYRFPWNTNQRPTILVHGQPPVGGGVTVRVEDANAPTLTAAYRESAGDPFGRRWEYTASAPEAGDIDFDVLQCVSTGKAALLGAVVPVLFFRSDVTFQFAHSVDNIEGQVEVDYPAHPDAQSVADEFTDDLINHNALNSYMLTDNGSVHLNPWSENYPLSSSDDNDNSRRIHHFAFRYARPVAETATAARFFYHDLYGQMQAPRRLEFGVEHTYGTQIRFKEPQPQLATHADFPPAMPTRVTRSSDEGTLESEDTEKTLANFESFMTVRLDPPSAQNDNVETVVLEFRTEWLEAAAALSEPKLHHAAWQAVAEMAHAKSCKLHLVPWRFDLRTAWDAGSTAKLSMADTLKNVVVEVPKALQVIDLRQDIVRLYDHWRDGNFDRVPPTITRPLEDPDGWRLYEMCNIVEFELSLTRDEKTVPDPHGDWRILRPKNHINRRGQVVETEDSSTMKSVFNKWLATLGERRDAIIAAPSQRLDGVQLRRLMGGGAGADNGSWIVPEGLQQIPEAGIRARMCPVSFRPVSNHALLGDDTHVLLGRYLQVFDDLLAGDVPQWREAKPEVWQGHWQTIGAISERGAQRLLNAVVALTLPIPNLEAVHSPIQPIVRALRRKQDGLGAAFNRWLGERLWQSPALYADAKAFLCTVVDEAGSGDTQALFSQYFRMRSTKTIREHADGSVLADRDLFTFRQALVVESKGSSEAEAGNDSRSDNLFQFDGLAQLEVLDDARYDNRFHLDHFALDTFEGGLEAMRSGIESAAVALQSAQRLPLGHIDLPAGAQRLNDDGSRLDGTPTPVLLASRTPVQAPQHEWTGAIQALQQDVNLAVGDEFDEDDLVRGRLVAADGAETHSRARLIGHSPLFKRSFQRDDFVLSTVFRVQGDEEAGGQVAPNIEGTDAFDNDSFHYRIVANAQFARSVDEPAPALVLDKKTRVLLELLRKKTQASELDVEMLQDVLDPTVLNDVAGLFERYLQPPTAEISSSVQVHIRQAGSGMDVVVRHDNTLTDGFEALVFAVQSPDGADKSRNSSVYLMLNLELRVWNRWMAALRQKRNMENRDGVPGVDFAIEFGQITEASRDSAPFQPAVVEPMHDHERPLKNPVVLFEREMDVRALMQRVLVDTGLVHDGGPAGPQPWLASDLSLTVSHRQMVRMPVAYYSADGAQQTSAEEGIVVHDSAFPLRNFRWTKDELAGRSGAKPVVFDPPHRAFELEFQWTSPTNLPFLRIRRVDVVFES